MNTILNFLDTTRQALLPQIRILEDSYLVTKRDDNSDIYELSAIGEMLLKKFEPLMGTLEILGTDVNYWGEHYLDFIPVHLLDRLCELDRCTVIEPDLLDMYELNRDFMEGCLGSRSVRSIVSFLHPDLPAFWSKCLLKGIEVSVIISSELYEKLKADHERYDEFRKFLMKDNLTFYCYFREMEFIAFSQNDNGFIFRLLTCSHQYDSKQLICSGTGSAKWGNDFFEHIKQQSVPITK